MTEFSQPKPFDLEDRTYQFASSVRDLISRLPRSLANMEDARQLVRSSGSLGANYIGANDALGRKEFLARMKIAKKEARECHYWLRLLDTADEVELESTQSDLIQEAADLANLFGGILQKSS